MNADQYHVAVIGAGITGLTVAGALADWGVQVSLFEKTPFLGGHAIQLNCKATDACVKCGACVAEDKLLRAMRHDHVDIHTATEIESVSGSRPYQIHYRSHAPLVDADQCDGCGICFQECPVPGAISKGRPSRGGAGVAIRKDRCRFFDNAACTRCQDACPQGAIHLADDARSGSIQADAIVLATGFSPYHPGDKPYGYGKFDNVISSLDAERLLRDNTLMKRPSDGRPADRIAFIQCVGSRDARLGHPWCSKICCGSSMRMARLIQSRQKEAQVAFFYIDVQTFGKDFECFYQDARQHIQMIRGIPGDINRTAADQLEIIYFDPLTKVSTEALFDLVVLSVGLIPSADNQRMAQMLDLTLNDNGFMPPGDNGQQSVPEGLFTAGTALGPMTIAESAGSAEKTVFDIIRYLKLT